MYTPSKWMVVTVKSIYRGMLPEFLWSFYLHSFWSPAYIQKQKESPNIEEMFKISKNASKQQKHIETFLKSKNIPENDSNPALSCWFFNYPPNSQSSPWSCSIPPEFISGLPQFCRIGWLAIFWFRNPINNCIFSSYYKFYWWPANQP